jgi:hypothetical protein
VAVESEPGDIMRVDFDFAKRAEFGTGRKPEQIVRLCVPAVSGVQWHPFTLVWGGGPSASAERGVASVFMGLGTNDWCNSAARALQAGADVRVDGPIGASGMRWVPPRVEDALVFFVAGSGITPALSVVRDPSWIPGIAGCWLTWSARSKKGDASLASFTGLRGLQDIGVRVKVHDTSPEGATSDSEGAVNDVQIERGRVDFARTLRDAAGAIAKGATEQPRLIVFVCGGKNFAGAARAAAADFIVEQAVLGAVRSCRVEVVGEAFML